MEARLVGFEDQLEEAQSATDAAEERYKRSLAQLEQLQADYSLERTNGMRAESQRASLEKQVCLTRHGVPKIPFLKGMFLQMLLTYHTVRSTIIPGGHLSLP